MQNTEKAKYYSLKLTEEQYTKLLDLLIFNGGPDFSPIAQNLVNERALVLTDKYNQPSNLVELT